jgi:imidazolonepropionase-like amidohydrolase
MEWHQEQAAGAPRPPRQRRLATKALVAAPAATGTALASRTLLEHISPAAMAAALLAAVAWAQDAPPPAGLLIKAARIVVSPDLTLANGAILVRGGKVSQVGDEVPAELAPGTATLDLAGKTVVPAMIAAHAHLGGAAQLAETMDAFTPHLKAADALDPYADEVARAARSGVLTVGYAPRSANTFAGLAAAAKTSPAAVLRDVSYLKLALVPESLSPARFPTSRMGALDLIRTSFAAAAGDALAEGQGAQVLRDARQGSLPAVIHARSHAEIEQALDLLAADGPLGAGSARVILLGADDLGRSLARAKHLGVQAILEPLTPLAADRALRLPGLLERHGIPFAFAGDDGRSLRTSAALAIKHGLSRAAALAALTRVPARQLGVDDRVGTLLRDHDADFLVFDGDPLDLTARLSRVYVGGVALAGSDAPAAEVQAARGAREGRP